MTTNLLIISLIIILCVGLSRVSTKIGIPMLLLFIVLGMLFGSDGIFRIQFDNYSFAMDVCSVALIFIMFYGGFGTNWKHASPVAGQAGILATLGVVLTAVLVAAFCHFVIHIEWMESLLLGSVISSTDAASVFSILRSKKLALKDHTDSLLELESGSNDPASFMMTTLTLTFMESRMGMGEIVLTIFLQVFFGILVSLIITWFAKYMLKRFASTMKDFGTVFIVGIALLAYSGADFLGGNGYLSAYLVGIMLGNSDIKDKKTLVPFFDGLTSLMQMLVFFLLGLLAFPHMLQEVFFPSLLVCLFLTFVARPAAVFALLTPFHCSRRQKLLVSFAGLRGAASIVFATMATVSAAYTGDQVFHIVFCIVLMSIAFQGTLIPWVAKKLDMIDTEANVLKTFTDYTEEVNVQFVEFTLRKDHPWNGKSIAALTLVPDMLIVLIRRNGEGLLPNGDTVMYEGDQVVLSAPALHDSESVPLRELTLSKTSKWAGKTIAEYSKSPEELIVLIQRSGEIVVPRGDTLLQAEDTLVLMEHKDF